MEPVGQVPGILAKVLRSIGGHLWVERAHWVRSQSFLPFMSPPLPPGHAPVCLSPPWLGQGLRSLGRVGVGGVNQGPVWSA